jgi:hypothetical protein
MILNSLESAKVWADIVTGSVTAGVLVLAGIAAFWRFFLQQPLGNNWLIRVTPCRIRRAGEQWGYFLALEVHNASAACHTMNGWWRQVRFADEVPPNYDPSGSLDVLSGEKALLHYGKESLIDRYPLAPGEAYVDHVCRFREGPPQEFCFIEYTLGYRAWKSKCVVVRWPGWEHISQILTAPVERDDLNAAKGRAAG